MPSASYRIEIDIADHLSIVPNMVLWLKLPHDAMREAGPAAQTLGGLLSTTGTSSFRSVKNLAQAAMLPEATVRKHLTELQKKGFVQNLGRKSGGGGRTRRTCTRTITPKAQQAAKHYAMLPFWAARAADLTWAAKAVLAVVMSRLAAWKSAREQQPADERSDWISDDWSSRFRFSLTDLCRETGLCRETVVNAKRLLLDKGVFDGGWANSYAHRFGQADYLMPRRKLTFSVSVELDPEFDRSNMNYHLMIIILVTGSRPLELRVAGRKPVET